MLGMIIGVAIGLAFVFLLLSLIATWVQELIATLLRWRSKELLNVVQNLLDPTTEKLAGVKRLQEHWRQGAGTVERIKKNFLKALYEHPLIKSLSKPRRIPSYIPAREFGDALVDLLSKAGAERTPAEGTPGEQAPAEQSPAGATFTGTAKATPEGGGPYPGTTRAPEVLEAFKRGVEELDNERTRNILRLFSQEVENTEASIGVKLAALRQRLADWFDAATERASGWYKRKAQLVGIGIGILLACALNVDTINLTKSLFAESRLRLLMNTTALEYLEREGESEAAQILEGLEESGLPIGWGSPLRLKSWLDYAFKIIGWIVTGLLVSLGSPIWFDLLNRLVNLRGAGTRPRPPG